MSINFKNYLLISLSVLYIFYYLIPDVVALVFSIVLFILSFVTKKNEKTTYVPIAWYFVFILFTITLNITHNCKDIILASQLNCLLFIIIISRLFVTKKDFEIFLKSYAIVGLVFSLHIYLRFGNQLGISRFGSYFEGTEIHNSILLSYILFSIICTQIFFIFYGSRTFKIVNTFGVIFLFVLIMFSGTRKLIFIPVFFALSLIILKNKKKLIKTLFLCSLAIIIFILALQFILSLRVLPQSVVERIPDFSQKSLYDKEKDLSLIVREDLIRKTTKLFFDHPIIGVGTDEMLYRLKNHPHNNYLMLLCIGGVFYFLAFYSMHFLVFKRLIKTDDKYSVFFISYILATLISDLGTNSTFIIYFTTFVALGYVYSHVESTEKSIALCREKIARTGLAGKVARNIASRKREEETLRWVEIDTMSEEDLMKMNKQLLTATLGLLEPWYVESIEFDPVQKRLDIRIAYTRGVQFICPKCGKPCEIFKSNVQERQYLDFFANKCYLHIEVPSIECSEHGVQEVENSLIFRNNENRTN